VPACRPCRGAARADHMVTWCAATPTFTRGLLLVIDAPEMPGWMAVPSRTRRDRCRITTFKVLDRLFPVAFLRFRTYRRLIRSQASYLYATGWMQSYKARRPLDGDGAPIPWVNFCVVGLLKERLTRDLSVFEFGSGYSTWFYADRAGTVTSVEYDKRWFEFVKAHVPANAAVFFKEGDTDGEYCRAILSSGAQYDVVVVDGTDRANCLKRSLEALSPKGGRDPGRFGAARIRGSHCVREGVRVQGARPGRPEAQRVRRGPHDRVLPAGELPGSVSGRWGNCYT
jgi:hypothetical protein